TWAMPVIMGRKTFESLDNQLLPGRFNIIITHQKNWNPGNDKVQVSDSLQKAIELAAKTDCKEAFIAGGGQLFAESIAIAERIYLTRVSVTIDGDAYFPALDPAQWEMVSHTDFPSDDKHVYAYSFQLWVRKK
ncbi:MAG TPA: dihydrofolate reductase, partial [Puia sp.]|nr:dihydrofolate reductase [Puia sp.]